MYPYRACCSGTGKTTVAKLYARILADMGLLSKSEVVMKNSSDFVGSALGTSQTITRGILAQAEGCVLVIDEAYGLDPSGGGGLNMSLDPYKTAVIDTIVEQVQGVPGEDRVVVMLGYREPMAKMLANANPGLARRFQMENAFNFSDYSDTSLIRIIQSTAKKQGMILDLDTAVFAVMQLAKAKAMPNFGNAGAVQNLLSEAKLRMAKRLSAKGQKRTKNTLIKEDFCLNGIIPQGGNEEDIFSDMVGCDEVLEKLREYRATIAAARSQVKTTHYNPRLFITIAKPTLYLCLI
jgi:SpoVK/Ycf46/Vps4 family AAA+-type ATPase